MFARDTARAGRRAAKLLSGQVITARAPATSSPSQRPGGATAFLRNMCNPFPGYLSRNGQQQERVRVLLAHAAPSPRRRGSWRGGGEKQRPLLRRRRNEARDPQATCEFASPVEQLRFSVERTEGHRHPATSNVWLPFSELPVPPSMPLHHLAGVYRELIQLASRFSSLDFFFF
ncbi:transmembrane protein 218 isoform X3 [Larus michahellis]|uniref:transmembrane protein 218 isoform X3 n=1 Tax=Larus michahellis TaxID=119627 RepID=UPI003D9AF1A5